MLKNLIEGRIVHYVIKASDVPPEFRHTAGQHRPALVVNTWPILGRDDGYANLTVFVDWSNDGCYTPLPDGRNVGKPCIWVTSVVNDEATKEPGTWHWIEGEPEPVIANQAEAAEAVQVALEQKIRDMIHREVKSSALK